MTPWNLLCGSLAVQDAHFATLEVNFIWLSNPGGSLMLTRAQGKCHRLWSSQAHTIYLAGLFSNVLPGRVCVCVRVCPKGKKY